MHTNLRWNPQFFSQSHNSLRALWPMSRTHIQSILFALGCFLLLTLLCLPTFGQASIPSAINVSDQKPGSILVFPLYSSAGATIRPSGSSSNLTVGAGGDTRIAISHNGNNIPVGTPPVLTAANVTVHLFFLDGATCSDVDFFVCLTPNGSVTLKASDIDPGITGYVIAVAVDGTLGTPIQANVLQGNAFVNIVAGTSPNQYVGNYSAESFEAHGPAAQLVVAPFTTGVANLNFNYPSGAAATDGYDAVPSQFAVQIQKPDLLNQIIVTAGMSGNLLIDDPLNPGHSAITGAGQIGSGQVFNENEKSCSFQRLLSPGCQAFALLTPTNPRVPPTGVFSCAISAGETGVINFKVGGAVGLLLTPAALTGAAPPTTNHGIRTLHKIAVIPTVLTIPTFVPPTCHTLNPLVP